MYGALLIVSSLLVLSLIYFFGPIKKKIVDFKNGLIKKYTVSSVRPEEKERVNDVRKYTRDLQASENNAMREVDSQTYLRSITGGVGIAVTPGESPTVTNTGVLSLGGKTGTIYVDESGLKFDGQKLYNADRGSSQNIFKEIKVDGEVDIKADTNHTNLYFAAGTGMEIDTNNDEKRITFNSKAGWIDHGSVVSLIDEADNLRLNGVTYAFPSTQGSAGTFLQNDGAGGLTWADFGAGMIPADSLDFTELKDNLTLDANTDIALAGKNFSFSGTGNVGIGTTSPNYTLHVEGNSYINGSLTTKNGITVDSTDSAYPFLGQSGYTGISQVVSYNTNPAGVGAFQAMNSGFNSFRMATYGSSYAGLHSLDNMPLALWAHLEASGGLNGMMIETRSNAPITFYTDRAERMRISGTGNIGIGTTSPLNKLHVVGNGTYTASFMSGNVGIGTTAPGSSLDVISSATGGIASFITTSSSSNPALISVNRSGNTTTYIGANGSVAQGQIPAYASYISSWNNNVAISIGRGNNNSGYYSDLLIGPTGNVGIGTTSPGYKLDVNGTARIGDVNNHNWIIDNVGEIAHYYGTETYPRAMFDRDFGGAFQDGWFFGSGASTSMDASGVGIARSGTRKLGLFTSDGTSRLERFTIDGSGNVGIGTTAPSTKLHVVGDARVTGAYYDSSNTAGSSGYVLTSTGTGTAWSTVSSALSSSAFLQGGNSFGALASLGTNDSYGLGIRTSGVERVRIDTNGNVGIGTTSPSGLLDVNGKLTVLSGGNVGVGTVTPGSNLEVRNSGNGNGLFLRRIAGSNGDGSYASLFFNVADSGITNNIYTKGGIFFDSRDTHARGNLYLAVNNTADGSVASISDAKLTIAESGNVGIGTTAPAQALQVNGAISASTSGGYGFNGGTGANQGMFASGNTTVIRTGATNGLIQLGDPTGSIFQNISGGNIGIGGTAASTNPSLYAGSNGNVGIGTTAPSTKLHVVGDARVTGAYYDSSNTAGSSGYVLTSTGTGTAWSTVSSALSSSAFLQGGNSFGALASLGTNDSYGLGIRTSGVERVRIDTNGNVGIGTTSPNEKLEVNGNLRFSGSSTISAIGSLALSAPCCTSRLTISGNGTVGIGDGVTTDGTQQLLVQATNFTNRKTSVFRATSGQTANISEWQNSAGSPLALINASGNVGIGTTSPSYALDVNGSIHIPNNNYFRVGNNLANDGAFLTNSQLHIAQGTAPIGNAIIEVSNGGGVTDLLSLTDNTTNVFIVKDGGNIGIGTTAPSQKLDVVGNINSSGTVIAGSAATFSSNGAGQAALYQAAGVSLNYYNGSSVAQGLVLNSSGNVGIGTTSPNSPLQVNGSIIAGGSSAKAGINTLSPLYLFTGHGEGIRLHPSAATNGTMLLDISDSTNRYAQMHYDGTNKLLNISSQQSGVGQIKFSIGSGTEAVRIDSSGNVGIGTTSPGAKLQIAAGDIVIDGGRKLTLDGGTGGNSIYRDVSTGATTISQINGFALYFTHTADVANAFAKFTSAGGLSLGSSYVSTNAAAGSIIASGSIGIGTTSPAGKFDITDTSNTAGSLSLTNNTATTIGNGGNTLGVIDLQSTSLTTGNFMNVELNGLTSGKGINLTSTSTGLTTGNLMNMYWNPVSAATATGDLFKIDIGANALVSGNLFGLYNNGSALFTVGTSKITSALPHEFTAAGDVSFASDISLTDQTSNNISSLGPLTITSGENYENLDLTLKAYGTGAVVIDQAALQLYSGENLAFDLDDGADSYISHNNASNYLSVFTDGTEVARFMSDGSVDANTTFDANQFDIAEYYPTTDSAVEAGDVVVLSKSDKKIEELSAYLVNKVDSKSTDKVLGVVSTKPGFSMGGGSFRSQFCAKVTDGNNGEATAREELIKSHLHDVARDLLLSQIKDEKNTGATPSATLKTIDEDILQNKVDELYEKYKKGENDILDEAQLSTIEDKIATCKSIKQVPIALAGRVPVKVDLTAGDIKTGDLLTASPYETGKAMKATGAGWVLGRALEDAKNGDKTVMVYVFISWYDPAQNGSVAGISTSKPLNLSASVLDGNLTATGKILANEMAVTDHFTVGLLQLNASENSINTVAAPLLLQNTEGAGEIQAFGGKLVMTVTGGIVSQDMITAKTVAAEQYAVLGASENASIGEGTIPAGKTEVMINNSRMKASSKVFVTATSTTGGKELIVKEKKDGSFTVVIESANAADITFDYWIVGVMK